MRQFIEQHPVFSFRVLFWTLYVILLTVLQLQHPTLIALTIGIFGLLSIARMVTSLVAVLLVRYKDYNIDVESCSMLKIDDTFIG